MGVQAAQLVEGLVLLLRVVMLQGVWLRGCSFWDSRLMGGGIIFGTKC